MEQPTTPHYQRLAALRSSVAGQRAVDLAAQGLLARQGRSLEDVDADEYVVLYPECENLLNPSRPDAAPGQSLQKARLDQPAQELHLGVVRVPGRVRRTRRGTLAPPRPGWKTG
jgi:hypothetical protein